MRAPGWGALEAAGALLWLAAPGGYPENTPVGEWSHWTVLQYSTAGGIDRDESESTFAQIAGGSGPDQPKEDDIMHFSEPWHTILWPNGHFSGYDPMVWTAIKYWYDNGTEQPGTEGTVVREIQTALDTVGARDATTVASAVAAVIPHVTSATGAALSPEDLQKIASTAAAAAGAALPKSYTLTAAPAGK
jgi:hypothetical protein